MKSRTLCACLVCMLFVSAVALGEIVKSTDWDGYGDVWGYYASSGARATAIDEETSPDSWAQGSWSLITTEAGWFDWWYYCEASAGAAVIVHDTYPCWADADSEADIEVDIDDLYDDVEAHAYVDEDDCGPPPDWAYDYDEPPSVSDSDYNYFQALEGIYAGHTVIAKAWIWDGSDNEATALADAGAAISLY